MQRRPYPLLASALVACALVACAGAAPGPAPAPGGPAPSAPPATAASASAPAAPAASAAPAAPARAALCSKEQAAFLREGDEKAAPHGIEPHLRKNFADGKVAWLMKEQAYQTYVVQKKAERFGRCDGTGCYLFAAPAARIHEAVKASMAGGKHDPERLGKALGLPAKNFEGALRLFTLDIASVCVRLPLERDPGVWKCSGPDDKDCFKFGGYTSGGVPELMVIDAAVAGAKSEEVP